MKVRQVGWSLFGLGLPLALALVCIPLIVRNVGLERFGLLSLAWGLVNYAGVFDLGIGRATTQHISRLRGLGETASIPEVLQVAIHLTMWTGGVGAILVVLAAVLDVQSLSRHGPDLDTEVTVSIVLLAFALPLQAMSATYRGVNEAFENFRDVSLIRIFLGAMNFVGPLAVSGWTTSLPWLVASLVVSRALAVGLFRLVANRELRRSVPTRIPATDAERQAIRQKLFRFGGWVTVSGVISPLMLQSDRFAIAAILSASAVATYTLPYELIVQSLAIVGAVSSVAFPSITRLMHQEPLAWRRQFAKWTTIITAIMVVVAAAMATILPVFLPLWAGAEIPAESITVGQILCIGVVANAIGSMYYALLHALGRTSITARVHLVEFAMYVAALPWLIQNYGIAGAAIAWSARMVIDAIALTSFGRRATQSGKKPH